MTEDIYTFQRNLEPEDIGESSPENLTDAPEVIYVPEGVNPKIAASKGNFAYGNEAPDENLNGVDVYELNEEVNQSLADGDTIQDSISPQKLAEILAETGQSQNLESLGQALEEQPQTTKADLNYSDTEGEDTYIDAETGEERKFEEEVDPEYQGQFRISAN